MFFFTFIGLCVFCYGLFYIIILFFLDCDLQLAFYEKFGKRISRLQGKVVFIIGASSGIGESIAIALGKHGVKLVLAARRPAELERVKGLCIASSGGKLTTNDVLVLPMDVLDLDSHQRHFNSILHHFGHIDILVNNAGRSQRAAWENIDLVVDKQLFDLNVFAILNLSRIAVKYFNKRGSGHIAVTSSIAGIIGLPYSATYTGSKHALHGYFNSLRAEKMEQHISVTLLCPGPTFSNFLKESFTDTPGETYGVPVQPTDRRMTAERCGELCAIALANKTNESWMCLYPILHMCYIVVYFPIIYNMALKIVGPGKLFKFRDSQETATLSEAKNKSE